MEEIKRIKDFPGTSVDPGSHDQTMAVKESDKKCQKSPVTKKNVCVNSGQLRLRLPPCVANVSRLDKNKNTLVITMKIFGRVGPGGRDQILTIKHICFLFQIF